MTTAASVWLGHAGGRSWSCDQCKEKRGLRALRGNCGGPFREELPQSRRDDRGVFVPAYRIAPDCDESFSEYEFRSCPVAGVNQLAPLIGAYNRHRSGLYPLSHAYPSPTCALIDVMETLESNRNSAALRAQQRMIDEGKA